MQLTDPFRCFDVDRVLVSESPLLHAQYEAKLFDVLRQVAKGNLGLFPFITVK